MRNVGRVRILHMRDGHRATPDALPEFIDYLFEVEAQTVDEPSLLIPLRVTAADAYAALGDGLPDYGFAAWTRLHQLCLAMLEGVHLGLAHSFHYSRLGPAARRAKGAAADDLRRPTPFSRGRRSGPDPQEPTPTGD